MLAAGGVGAGITYAAVPTSTSTTVKVVQQFASYGTARSLVPGQTVPVLAQPHLNAHVVVRLVDGAPAGIVCTSRGDQIQGNWGRTSLWDRVSLPGGKAGWVNDGLLYTGTNSAVAPACSRG